MNPKANIPKLPGTSEVVQSISRQMCLQNLATCMLGMSVAADQNNPTGTSHIHLPESTNPSKHYWF